MTPLSQPSPRRRFVPTLALAMGAACLGGARAADSEVTRRFDLPVASAAMTLRQFAEQSGVDVVFSTEATARRQTNAVKGDFLPEQALALLLKETGLVAERNSRTGAFTVFTAPPPSRGPPRAPPASPPKPPEKKASVPDPSSPPPSVKKPSSLSLFASLLAVGAASAQAQTAPGEPPTTTAPVVLSPFTVSSEKDTGYQSSDTLAGSRLSTPIKDIAASISVYNKDFLNDIGATNANDLLIYATGMEAGGPGGNFSNAAGSNITETNVVGDSVRNALQSASRSRGLSGPTFSRGFFATEVSVDSYNTSSVTVNRGPNAILFGVASPAGVVDTTLLRADLFRNISKVEFRYGNNDAMRATLDLNRVLIPKKLAFRLASVADDERYNQRPAFENKRRLFGAVTFQPYRATVLRADVETGNTKANRPFSVLPFNSISPQWYAAGRQAFDWTFYDDPARNPLAASQSSSGNIPGNALGTPAVPFRGFLVGQQGFFGPPVFQIANTGTGGGQISTGFYSGARTTNITGSGSLAINSIRNQLFDPVFNRDSAGDGQQFYESRNGSEIPGDFYPDRRVPAGIKTQGFTDFSAFDWENQQIDETGRQNDTFRNLSLSLEQRGWGDRVGVELAYFREHYARPATGTTFSPPKEMPTTSAST
ncbi:MAG: TonB-dependent receptor plug domain-containing protein [Opitutaceae bacterium]